MHLHKRRNHKGGALISALFITALAAIIATALAVDEALLIREGRLAMNSDQAYLVLQNAGDFAQKAIEAYVLQWPIGTQAPPPMAQMNPLESPLKTLEIGLVVSTTLVSAQGKFNINDLAYVSNQPNFVALIQAIIPTVQQAQAMALAQAITAWIMTGADDPYYATLRPAYRSPKNQLTDISELRLVHGITPQIYAALAPHVTALPIVMPTPASTQGQLTQIDVNAATAPALIAANPGLNMTQAQSIVDCRQSYRAFQTVQDFTAHCVVPSGVSSLQQVTTQTNYYFVHAETSANHTILWMDSLLMTEVGKDNKLKIIKIWQTFA